MRKFLLYGVLTSMLALGFASCSSVDDEPWTEPEVVTEGVYILNSGSSSAKINSTLGYYNPETKSYTKNIFDNQNDMTIGNTGNDMVIYGSKMYILATVSNKIYITDLKGKLLKYSDGKTDAIISPMNDTEPAEPRYAVAHGGKVYVSTKAGFVARIDTTSMTIDKTVTVGPNPEQMTVINNTLYVPNSGYGDGNTVSAVDLNSFTETKKIDVVQNPCYTAADSKGNLYIASWGKTWGGSNVKSQLQKYNPSTDKVTAIGTDIATLIAMSKDGSKLFLIKQIWGAEGQANEINYYDVNNEKVVTDPYFKLPEASKNALNKAYSISVDPVSGDIYISTSDYSTNGDMYVFGADGTYKDKFDTQGVNPIGAYFVTGIK